MKTAFAALVLATLPAAALAQSASGTAPGAEPGFHTQLYQRYCDKLRESPQAYVAFVKRMSSVHGYAFDEFVARENGTSARHVCAAVEKLANAPKATLTR